jgi:hypothetical protein
MAGEIKGGTPDELPSCAAAGAMKRRQQQRIEAIHVHLTITRFDRDQ